MKSLSKRYILLAALCLLNVTAQAQLNLSPIWCFGKNAGLDFSKNPPSTFTTPMVTSEGSGGATDGMGNILFYTDGRYVYNKNHQVMPNGTGLTGSPSSSQSAIVLQHPSQSDDNLFYVFTVPEYAGTEGFCYSIVDMDADGGLGDVITKNVKLYSDVLSEQMQPAMHSNGVDYWIVIKGHNNTEIHSFLIDKSGVTLKQTVSLGNSINNTIGCMRFNDKYDKFAFTCYDYSGYVQICDFNNTTGVVSNALVVDGLYDPYGIAFSPNGRFLYVSHLLTRKIRQYDLQQYNKAAILNSAYSLTNVSFAYGQISKAWDGKLYMSVTGQQYIACIANADQQGASCNFTLNAVSLGSNSCTYGLPLFYDYPKQQGLRLGKEVLCAGDSSRFWYSAAAATDTLEWLLDTGKGFAPVSVNPDFKYLFHKPGNYRVMLISGKDTGRLDFSVLSCKDCELKVPNVFTPGTDDFNDHFSVDFNCQTDDFMVYVYDRWGQKLYESDRTDFGWDGTYKSSQCSTGVYYYIITYTHKDAKKIMLEGVIHLIR